MRDPALSRPPDTALSVRARGIEKRFGSFSALRGVDVDIPSVHLLVVLGPNGAGKSTLVRIVAGLLRPTAGTIEFGEAHPEKRRNVRGQIGFVGHATMLYPELTARENLVFAGRLHGLDNPAERARELLAEEGLEAWSDRRAQTFSRGLAQRLSIARARVHDPRVLLLDEPFTGLDGTAADRLAERLERLREDGRSLVLVTHDFRQASRLGDQALLLANGHVAYRAEAPLPSASELDEISRHEAARA